MFKQEYERIPSKYRSQISRKTFELQNNPFPGGSRTSLKGYGRLCRLRVGDYRVIYAYDDKVVQLMNLRRRDEHTYDKLDEEEINQFETFKEITGTAPTLKRIPSWAEASGKQPERPIKKSELLPEPITEALLTKLGIGTEFIAILGKLKTVDELLDIQLVPLDLIEKIIEAIYPKAIAPVVDYNTPIREFTDLVDPVAAVACGPIVATLSEEQIQPIESTLILASKTQKSTPFIAQSSWRSETMKPYLGNTSRGISKDSRYTITADGNIRLQYSIGHDEKALLTTDAHPDLVAMVNEAKRIGGNPQGGGSFAINEYRHVLVPTTNGQQVLFAGTYTRDLEFDFNGTIIGPVAPISIQIGQEWPGPHVGIRYTLVAGATDVRYESTSLRGNDQIKTETKLSNFHAPESLGGLVAMFKAVKSSGGAIYINEARELFAPLESKSGVYKRVYIGHLGKHPWFPSTQ